jgi:RND family efflux transporter MFP subunit
VKRTALTVIICLSWCTLAAQDETMAYPPARVEVAVAEVRNMAPQVEVSGSVVSLNDSRIAAEVEGVITWLANVGDAVDAGAVIARINPRLMEVALKRAQANVARLEADLTYRERQLKRAEELAAKNNASANLLDESRSNRDQAQQLLNDARAQLERAGGDLDRTKIRAAFAGHVTERFASIGEYVDIGEDILRLVDTHRMEISLPAPLALTGFVKPGLTVAARYGAVERQHPVRAVVPVGDATSRMVEVRLAVADGDWLVGTPVQVGLPSATPVTAVAVPRDALVERGGQALIYKVTDNGTAEQVTVRITSTVGLWVAVAEGVAAGDLVIVRGAERLGPDQAVEVIGPANPR